MCNYWRNTPQKTTKQTQILPHLRHLLFNVFFNDITASSFSHPTQTGLIRFKPQLHVLNYCAWMSDVIWTVIGYEPQSQHWTMTLPHPRLTPAWLAEPESLSGITAVMGAKRLTSDTWHNIFSTISRFYISLNTGQVCVCARAYLSIQYVCPSVN